MGKRLFAFLLLKYYCVYSVKKKKKTLKLLYQNQQDLVTQLDLRSKGDGGIKITPRLLT